MHHSNALSFIHDWDYSQRLSITIAVAVVCGAYLHTTIRRLAPSSAAFVAAAPVFIVNTFLPLIFHGTDDELLSRGICCMLFPFLGNLKTFGLCCNRSSLAAKSWNTAESVLLYMLPIHPSKGDTAGVKRGRLHDDAGSPTKVATSFICNTTLLSVMAYLLATTQVPTAVKYYMYALGLYGFITMAMDGTAAVLIALFDLRIVPPFDKPWLSNSLADFWGRRWNNTVSLSLRSVVYDPIIEGHLFNTTTSSSSSSSSSNGTAQPAAKPPVPTAAAPAEDGQEPASSPTTPPNPRQQAGRRVPLQVKALATLTIFVVSGAIHEYILYLMSPDGQFYPGWWFMFFVIQVPLMIAEGLVLHKLKAAGVKVPLVLGIASTTLCLMVTAHAFWFPPLEGYRGNLAERIVGCVNRNFAALLAGLVDVMSQLGVQWDLKKLL